MNNSKEAGLTLIETLAVTVILTIVSLFIYSIISQSQTTFQKQTTTNKEINDAAYALKVMTKELRKTINVTVQENCTLKLDTTSFSVKDNTLYQDDTLPLASDIKSFKVTKGAFDEGEHCLNNGSNQVSIKILTNTEKVYSTEIYLRGGK